MLLSKLLNINFNYSLSSIDYRLLNAMGMDSYYYPTSPETDRRIQSVWN